MLERVVDWDLYAAPGAAQPGWRGWVAGGVPEDLPVGRGGVDVGSVAHLGVWRQGAEPRRLSPFIAGLSQSIIYPCCSSRSTFFRLLQIFQMDRPWKNTTIFFLKEQRVLFACGRCCVLYFTVRQQRADGTVLFGAVLMSAKYHIVYLLTHTRSRHICDKYLLPPPPL